MELNDFKAKLKSGSLGGCYVFCGEEDYLKRYYLGELLKAAEPDETMAVFNHLSFDGAEVDVSALLEAVKAPPMMSDYKIVEWKYPALDKMKDSQLDAFEQCLDIMDGDGYTVMTFFVADGELATGKRAGKFTKRFGERVNILRLDKSTDTQLLSWLKRHFDAKGIGASEDTLKALLFRSGHSMSTLNQEVEKLTALALARGLGVITESEVNEAASTTAESDTFALSNAILDKNKKAAYLALSEMKSRRVDPIIITAMMARTYSDLVTVAMLMEDGMGAQDIAQALKMNPYKLKIYMQAAKKYTLERARKILAELSRMDTASKYGGITGYAGIELFVGKCI